MVLLSTLSTAAMASAIDHLVLPHHLPGREDALLNSVNTALADALIASVRSLRDAAYDSYYSELDVIRRCLEASRSVNLPGKINQASLVDELGNMQSGGFLVLHVTRQNAGLIVRRVWDRSSGDNVIFEAFEASSLSSDVLASESGALARDFPGSSVSIPYGTFSTPSLLEEVSRFLSQASSETVKQFAARAARSGTSTFESRETANPTLITSMFMTLLEANGKRVDQEVLRKRVRDSVSWSDGAENPWRRSAYWVVLRVAVERQLSHALGRENGLAYYKFLIGIVLSKFLEAGIDKGVTPQAVTELKAKLCRRMAKLEKIKEIEGEVYDELFNKHGKIIMGSVHAASRFVESMWESFKSETKRRIAPLPMKARGEDTRLSLTNSYDYVHQILNNPLRSKKRGQGNSTLNLDVESSAVIAMARKSFGNFADKYYTLSQLEEELQGKYDYLTQLADLPNSGLKSYHCEQLEKIAADMHKYMGSVRDNYDGNPEGKSKAILTVMRLWCFMDSIAVRIYPLLEKYDPVFTPESLDVLRLPELRDMQILQQVQAYLSQRAALSSSKLTIFSDPVHGCLAERWYDNSADSDKLKRLHERIEEVAERNKLAKRVEWENQSRKYEEVIKKVNSTACIYYIATDGTNMTLHDDRNCKKCYMERCARRMRIRIHEHPLPTNEAQKKAVLFELEIPKAFAAYRDITWRILETYALPDLKREEQQPKMDIRSYSELQQFVKNNGSGSLTLASHRKSSLQTHYEMAPLPVDFEDICFPNGLGLGYWDERRKVWSGRLLLKPTFAQHCRYVIPQGTPFAKMQWAADSAMEGDGPSSNEVIASQSKCPVGLNVQEYLAYQNLLGGKQRRWLAIIIELGSSNLNFSTEATSLLIEHLAMQAGPKSADGDVYRTCHAVFRDKNFRGRLLEQLAKRLDAISINWRETNAMHMIVTLALRVYTLSRDTEALELLEKAREVTHGWIGQLRKEIYSCTTTEDSRKFSGYTLWAALLCRRTFATAVGSIINSKDLTVFLEASMALQDNMVQEVAKSKVGIKNVIVADIRMAHALRTTLRQSIREHGEAVTAATSVLWPEVHDCCARLRFLSGDCENWIEMLVENKEGSMQQTWHYHILEGHVLVDHQPLGLLPAEHRSSVTLKLLFGDQNLLTYPSSLPGMSYRIPFTIRGKYSVHMGFRHGVLIVRAWNVQTKILYEIIPREVFQGHATGGEIFDLPSTLIENCVHWLDVNRGELEVRQCPNIWTQKPSNWIINYRSRMGFRRQSMLVDTRSQVFKQIAHVFSRFEYAHYLTVVQPERWNLNVELRRLELTFVVNSKKLLESRELRSEIDPDQDCGALYGLSSKIVLRDTLNPGRRSILVPLGKLNVSRNRFHVDVVFVNEGNYGRYQINDVLGRLECPVEPRLLYMKALMHAYTSFVLPDPLTGRTGMEEALNCLKSGLCQPWQPVSYGPYTLSLCEISKLTPRRNYYPEGMKYMEKTSWLSDLPTSLQHDEYYDVVESIRAKSEQLSLFTLNKPTKDPMQTLQPVESPGDEHLIKRGLRRWKLYHRSDEKSDEPKDIIYNSRDGRTTNQSEKNTYAIVNQIREWRPEVVSASGLATLLKDVPLINGFSTPFEKMLLSDVVSTDVTLDFCPLVNHCCESTVEDKYKLMFMFGLMSFRQDANMDLINTVAAFAIIQPLKFIPRPEWPIFERFGELYEPPTKDFILSALKTFGVEFTAANDLRGEGAEFAMSVKYKKKIDQARRDHERKVAQTCESLAMALLRQWPCLEPSFGHIGEAVLVDLEQVLDALRPEWGRLFGNMQLSAFIESATSILVQFKARPDVTVHPLAATDIEEMVLFSSRACDVVPTLSADLLGRGYLPNFPLNRRSSQPLQLLKPQPNNPHAKAGALKNSRANPVSGKSVVAPMILSELEQIARNVEKSDSLVRQRYGQDLIQSLNALKKCRTQTPDTYADLNNGESIMIEVVRARQDAVEFLKNLKELTAQDDARFGWLRESNMWPSISPISVLSLLSHAFVKTLSKQTKELLISYGLCLTRLQRILRLQEALERIDQQKIQEEQRNIPHVNWDPRNYPDWLLLEIDGNFLIRAKQVDVALATMFPGSGNNSVLQLLMGEGKTSCIMPMCAAVLANSKTLVRVVVPRSLLLQTAQVLSTRLGGLVGRQMRHIPFSRKTPTNKPTMEAYLFIHQDMLKKSGLILSLPEHILSFNLSGLQRLLDKRKAEAGPMIRIQSWLRSHCRDILDESDLIMSARTQLIYPSGAQKTVDGHPDRWRTVQALLALVENHLWSLQTLFPQSIEVIRKPDGGYPIIFFLRTDAEEKLIQLLANEISTGGTTILPMEDVTDELAEALRTMFTEPKVPPAMVQSIKRKFLDKSPMMLRVYHLRGLLAHRLLLLTLKKRWSVQYGLDPARDPVAVPFHAKGVPSEQAEWGHPDVSILLTCLSFYYGGLDTTQFRKALEHVLKSDDPSIEYDHWAEGSSLPDSLRDWSAINVDDESQLAEIWKALHLNVDVVNHFLNNFVFPKHAKQFSTKLQASGWDVPLLPPDDGSLSKGLTTGFSGTNDNRSMLPLCIKQEDLPALAHTNAEVLTYLLQPRNRCYVMAAHDGKRLSERGLLKVISDMEINVLIDAGAQILEMDNYDLVQAWLEISTKKQAAVFFDKSNKAMVLFRKGHLVPLLATPFVENTANCLVYLDEAHTRGTDLKLPINAVGALTLGLGQSKDATVQAAMRMRHLGTSQSVVFFAPPEVHQSILDVTHNPPGTRLDSNDVIRWLLEQTCSGIEQLQPLYISQGMDFCRRFQASLDNRYFLEDADQLKEYLGALQQTEQQTLKQLYEPRMAPKPVQPIESPSVRIAAYIKELKYIRKKFKDNGSAVHGSALQEVEQERITEAEVENVREVQKPYHYQAIRFGGLHEDIVKYATHGRLLFGSIAYEAAMAAVKRTATGMKYGISNEEIQQRLFVSAEFKRTVKVDATLKPNDNFLRQVNYILISSVIDVALVISPEEAEQLLSLPILHDPTSRNTYLILYAAPITWRMLQFNSLKYYSIPTLPPTWSAPSWLKVELGILSGRLYFPHDELSEVKDYLGLNQDGKASFTGRPLKFMHDWLTVRRKGQDISHTPMGYICDDKPLNESHPFFRRGKVEEEEENMVDGVAEELGELEVDDEYSD